ncbi:MAG: type II toxin-antitoxin system RelE/ParE family toxin [Panacagrimonas sp.]
MSGGDSWNRTSDLSIMRAGLNGILSFFNSRLWRLPKSTVPDSCPSLALGGFFATPCLITTISGRGKSGGARTLLATNRDSRWFFVYGFLKNERANVTVFELEALKSYASDLLSQTDAQLRGMIEAGGLTEICHE